MSEKRYHETAIVSRLLSSSKCVMADEKEPAPLMFWLVQSMGLWGSSMTESRSQISTSFS